MPDDRDRPADLPSAKPNDGERAGPELTLARPTQHWPGTAVTISIRPENFTVVDPATPGAISLSVRVVMPLGASGVIEGVAPSGEAIKISQARSSAAFKAGPGASIGLVVSDMSAVSLFSVPSDPTVTDATKGAMT